MENSKIEWTHHTLNLWQGCTKVHAGCDHCYAETLAKRWRRDIWGNDKPRLLVGSANDNAAKFQRLAAAAGEVHRVFLGSMMDIFEKPVITINSKGEFVEDFKNEPILTDEIRAFFFDRIVAGQFPNLKFLLLTKRPSNIQKYLPPAHPNFMDGVAIGTSPCDQPTYDTLARQLLNNWSYNNFLSIEPMLGPIIIPADHLRRLNWVIVGGESGPGKRPINLNWARALRDQCLAHDVPFFFKQVDKVQPIPADLLIRQFPKF